MEKLSYINNVFDALNVAKPLSGKNNKLKDLMNKSGLSFGSKKVIRLDN